MAEFKRFLVPVDFTDTCRQGLETALELAVGLGGEILVMHTVEMSAVNVPPEGGMLLTEDFYEEQSRLANERLEELVTEFARDNVAISQHVYTGDAATRINQAAEELHADMIVIGTHGRKGLSHLLIGSVAENVLHNAKVPVLCVKSE